MFLLIVYLECGDWSSISGMLSRMRGLELNVGDFELNVGDFDKKREIFRGDRGMPRRLGGERSAPVSRSRDSFRKSRKVALAVPMRVRGDPRNRRRAITLVWRCRARLAGAFELE